MHQQGINWTWSELADHVEAFAAGLVALGLQPGDRIGIWSPNNAEWIITQFATAKAGLILVNINPAYRLTEVEYALNKVGCKALITATRFKTSDYIGMINTLAPELAIVPSRASCMPQSCPRCDRLSRSAAMIPAPSRFDKIAHHGREETASGCRNWRRCCSSTTRSISSSPPARPGCRRARR